MIYIYRFVQYVTHIKHPKIALFYLKYATSHYKMRHIGA